MAMCFCAGESSRERSLGAPDRLACKEPTELHPDDFRWTRLDEVGVTTGPKRLVARTILCGQHHDGDMRGPA